MKSFEYYSVPEVVFFSHTDRRKLIAQLREGVDAKKMTMLERQDAVRELEQTVEDAANAKNKLYAAACEALKAEFWVDARAELGYDKIYNATGCELLEQDAWAVGHAYSFEEVFAALQARLDFVKQIIESQLSAAVGS